MRNIYSDESTWRFANPGAHSIGVINIMVDSGSHNSAGIHKFDNLGIVGVTVKNFGIVTAVVIVLGGVVYLWFARTSTVSAALNSGDYAAARQLLLPMAEAGDPVAQNQLGALYSAGLGGPRDYRIAAGWMLQSALQGNSSAQINISHLYRRGWGVPRDHMRAVGWLWHARSSNNEAAENHLKWLTGNLQVTANQIQRAKELYRRLEALEPKQQAN